jgi:two-component system, cell cycle response regulator
MPVPLDTLTILLVEDNPGDVGLFRQALKEAYSGKLELLHCTSLTAALESIARTQLDVIVVDLGLPDAYGIEVVKRCRAAAAAIPIVVSTGRDDEGLGLQALQEGAQDYLIKGELDPRMLARALRYAIERQRMQAALQSESVIDELTRLYNRKGFLALAGNQIKTAARTGYPVSLAFVDLDGLKQINDTLGHLAGDQALVETAKLLSRCIRRSDVVARLGGDEFVMLLSSAGQDAEGLIQNRVQIQLAHWNTQRGRHYRLALSIGVVTACVAEGVTLEELMTRADGLMYKQKQAKKLSLQAAATRVPGDPPGKAAV